MVQKNIKCSTEKILNIVEKEILDTVQKNMKNGAINMKYNAEITLNMVRKNYEMQQRKTWNIVQKNIKYCAKHIKDCAKSIKYSAEKLLNMVQKEKLKMMQKQCFLIN